MSGFSTLMVTPNALLIGARTGWRSTRLKQKSLSGQRGRQCLASYRLPKESGAGCAFGSTQQ
jgi:hypothetical protein